MEVFNEIRGHLQDLDKGHKALTREVDDLKDGFHGLQEGLATMQEGLATMQNRSSRLEKSIDGVRTVFATNRKPFLG
jgi:uncharacterized phage infection (PIP) family protein YhgE